MRIWYILARNVVLFLLTGYVIYRNDTGSDSLIFFLPAISVYFVWEMHFTLISKLPRQWTESEFAEQIAKIDVTPLRSGNISFFLGLLALFLGFFVEPPLIYWPLAACAIILPPIFQYIIFWKRFGRGKFPARVNPELNIWEQTEKSFDIRESLISRYFTKFIAFPIVFLVMFIKPIGGSTFSILACICGLLACYFGATQQYYLLALSIISINVIESGVKALNRGRGRTSIFSRWWKRLVFRFSDICVVLGLAFGMSLEQGFQDGSLWLTVCLAIMTLTWLQNSLHLCTGLLLFRPRKQPVRTWRFQWKSAKLTPFVTEDWIRYAVAIVLILHSATSALITVFCFWTFVSWGRSRKLVDKDDSW
ncbi:MAG: hypothetical protein JKX97_03380 [Candidatus Lindowbacteria bacterium]|nr:hypothetical protein [Candidatus Lindowbacteria bacterium]